MHRPTLSIGRLAPLALGALGVLSSAPAAQTLRSPQATLGAPAGSAAAGAGSASHNGFVECTRRIATFTGEGAGDQFGWVSAAVPDIDGDGVQELLTSAPFRSTTRAGSGRIYLYSGKTGVELFQVNGIRQAENLGISVSAAGDVNNDGVEDIVAGGPGSPTRPGLARVRSGFDGSAIWTASPGSVGDGFGASVTGVGDVDGDDYDDVAVGAPLDSTAAANAGRVYILSGFDMSVLWTIDGEATGDQFGSGMGVLGDVNGDGKAELAVGAMNGGPGNRGKVSVYDLQTRTRLYARQPDTSGANYGQYFVYAVGDVNNDTWPDLYVSDFADSGGRGKAYIYSGPTGALLWKLQGQLGDGFGIGRDAGDVDFDGFDDILLASWTNSTGAVRAGKADVFSGRTGAKLRTITSTTPNETLGFDAHGIGDADGDGHPDFVLTAAGNTASRGIVYLVAGGSQFENFGAGLAGTGGLEPRIAFTGCPELGGAFDLDVDQIIGDAHGCLIIGNVELALPFRGGTMYTNSNLFALGHRADGAPGVAGAGTAHFSFVLPNDSSLSGTSWVTQSAYLDGAAPKNVSMTGALRFRVF